MKKDYIIAIFIIAVFLIVPIPTLVLNILFGICWIIAVRLLLAATLNNQSSKIIPALISCLVLFIMGLSAGFARATVTFESNILLQKLSGLNVNYFLILVVSIFPLCMALKYIKSIRKILENIEDEPNYLFFIQLKTSTKLLFNCCKFLFYVYVISLCGSCIWIFHKGLALRESIQTLSFGLFANIVFSTVPIFIIGSSINKTIEKIKNGGITDV